MFTRLRNGWRLPMALCSVSLSLTILYLCSYNVFGQIPPPYGYGYGYGYGGPTVQFSASSYTVSEGDTITITVTLSAASSMDVFVSYATSNGSGQAGVDYTSANGTRYFPPGTTSQTFDVSTMTDPNNTSYVTANLTLSPPVNATLGDPSMATLYIVNPSACSSQ